MFKIAYYCIAFGNPNIKEKYKFLINNLIILNKCQIYIDLYISIYDDSIINIPKKLYNKLYISRKKGYLLQLVKKNEYLQNIFKFNYDYVLFILDDIELSSDFNLHSLLNKFKLKNNKIDIITPVIINDGWKHLSKYINNKNIKYYTSTIVEFFMYIMKPSTLYKYLNCFDNDFHTFWGYDFLIVLYFKFNIIIDNENIAKHYYRNTSANKRGVHEFLLLKEKYHNFFKKHFPLLEFIK